MLRSEANVTVTNNVSTNVFKPPRKIKKAAPAPPVSSGNHHQRSASVTILTSTLQELTASGVTTRDDLLDRKAATLTRPKVPPPARPTLPTLPPVEDHPAQLEVASRKEERAERRNVLDVLPPFSKKPVSRSLDDVVSESCRGEGSEMFHVNTSYESETISDTEDVFPHRCMPNLSLNMAAQSEDSEASFGPDEQAVVACLDNVLCEHDQSVAEQPVPHQASSIREKPTKHDGSSAAELLNTEWKSSAESQASGKVAKNLSSISEVGPYPVSTPDVSIEPPTPEVSGLHSGKFQSVGEPPCIDKSGKKPEMIFAHTVARSNNLPAANDSLSSGEIMVAKPKERDSELLVQYTPTAFQLKRDVAETESWKVASGADKVAAGTDGSWVNVMTGEQHNEVMSTTDRFVHSVGDTVRQDFGTKKESECHEVSSIRSYKDRHAVSASDYKLGAVAEKEVGSTLSVSSGRERSQGDVVVVRECQEMDNVGAKQRNDVVSVRPYKDRHEVNVQVDYDESQDSKSHDYHTSGFLGKPNDLDRKLDDFQDKGDDSKQKQIGHFPQKANAFEKAVLAKPGVTSSSFMASTKPVGFDGTAGSTFERPLKPVDFVPLGAIPAGKSSTSVPLPASVSMTASGTNSSYVATAMQVGTTSTGSSSSVVTTSKPVRAGVIPAGTDPTSVALTKSIGVTPTGTGSSLSEPTNSSVNSVAPTKPSDHSEMVQSLKLFFLSGSLNPDQSPSAPATRGRSNSDVNLFRPPAADATSMSKSSVDTSSESGGIAPTPTHYSSSMDIRSNAMSSSRESYFATLVEPSSPPRHLSQSNAVEGATRISRPGVPPPPPARRNRPSDSSTTSATARRSVDDASKIVIEDTRL